MREAKPPVACASVFQVISYIENFATTCSPLSLLANKSLCALVQLWCRLVKSKNIHPIDQTPGKTGSQKRIFIYITLEWWHVTYIFERGGQRVGGCWHDKTKF